MGAAAVAIRAEPTARERIKSLIEEGSMFAALAPLVQPREGSEHGQKNDGASSTFFLAIERFDDAFRLAKGSKELDLIIEIAQAAGSANMELSKLTDADGHKELAIFSAVEAMRYYTQGRDAAVVMHDGRLTRSFQRQIDFAEAARKGVKWESAAERLNNVDLDAKKAALRRSEKIVRGLKRDHN